ncbi:MAG: hypothetical protein AAFR61_23655 [Bacteroidota bacterium]
MEDQIFARLKKNVKTNSRPNSLLEIAKDIEWLRENYGNNKRIASELDISSGMVNTFLSALKVSENIQALISARKIDSVFSVHALKALPPNDQETVALEIAAQKFTSQQARALVPLRNIFPSEPIGRLMEVIRTTKDNKSYVNHFPMPDKEGLELIHSRINKIASPEPFSLENIDNIGVFRISKTGVKKMREDANLKKIGFHSYLLALFNPKSAFEEGNGQMMN